MNELALAMIIKMSYSTASSDGLNQAKTGGYPKYDDAAISRFTSLWIQNTMEHWTIGYLMWYHCVRSALPGWLHWLQE